MITRTSAVVAAGGTLRRVEGRPPLTLRRIRSEDRSRCALALVGTAAGPLAGDDLVLDLVLGAGARSSLRATGAHIAQGRAGQARSSLRMSATLGADSELVADPGPLVVCAGGTVEAEVSLVLGPGAAVDWSELIVLGRTGEPAAGRVGLHWDVRRHDGSGTARPLLRQRLDLADPELAGWGGLLRGRRVLASRLLVGPQIAGRTIVDSPLAVAQQLADDAVLVTVLADEAADASGAVDALSARIVGPAPPAHEELLL